MYNEYNMSVNLFFYCLNDLSMHSKVNECADKLYL